MLLQARLTPLWVAAVAKASPNRAIKFAGADPKPVDLPLVRMKVIEIWLEVRTGAS